MRQAADEVPAKFYKYRPMNTPELVQRVEKIVLHNEIFFAQSHSFNDPFDLKPTFTLDAPPDLQREYYMRLSRKFQAHLSDAQHNEDADNMMAKSLDAENIAKTVEVIQDMHSQALTRVGVFCVSTKRDDILMWSHYADSHKGVCLEFDGMSRLMAHAQKVNYSRKRVPINPYADDNMAMMEKAMLTKSEHWAYETEWRLCRYKEGPGPVQYRPTNLTGIILGALASRDTLDTVQKWVSQRASPLAIYRATTSGQDFELLIELYK
jgi:Protein of unknown function (DUF2971)